MMDSSERFELLRVRYAQSLPSKYAALSGAWHAFEAARDEASGRELQTMVHRLAGSAPAYGYALLGELASAIDGEFTEWENGAPEGGSGLPALAHRIAAPMQALLDRLGALAAAVSAETAP